MGRALFGALLAMGCGGSTSADDAGPNDTAVTAPTDSGTFEAAPDTAAVTDTAVEEMDTEPPAIDRSRCVGDPDVIGLTVRKVPGKPTAEYFAYAPPGYDKTKPTSLLIALHGAGDIASNYLSAVWRANADKRGFVVIAPDGSCASGPGNTWCMEDGKTITAAIDDIAFCYSIDKKRRILDGFSAGGIFAYAALQVAKQFAGISIAASDFGSAEAAAGKILPAPWKIPVSHHHGTMDMNFPIDSARAGRDKLIAAGHTVHWHEFDGGHTTTAAFALVRWDDLATSRAP